MLSQRRHDCRDTPRCGVAMAVSESAHHLVAGVQVPESESTLSFAAEAKKIVLNAVANEYESEAMQIKRLEAQVSFATCFNSHQ